MSISSCTKISSTPTTVRRACAPALAAAVLVAALLGCDPEEPPVVVAPVKYDDLVEGCIAATGCGVKAYPRVSNCVEAYYNLHRRFGVGPLYDRIYHCVKKAQGDCREVFACFGANAESGECTSSFQARCSEGYAVSCDLLDHRVFAFDCQSVGLTCQVKNTQSFEASCAVGSCSSSYASRCEGERVLTCRDGVIEVEDCQAMGLKCGSNNHGKPGCVGNSGKSCNMAQYKASCTGAAAATCEGGKVHVEDCSKRHFNKSCKDGACVATGKACADQFDTCADQTTLKYCLDGTWHTADCTSLGFRSCYPDATTGAVCKGTAL